MQHDFLYVVGVKNRPDMPTKIGITRNLRQRFRAMNSGFPFELYIESSFKKRADLKGRLKTISIKEIEQLIFIKLKDTRVKGEWFNMKPEFVSAFIKNSMRHIIEVCDCK